MDNDNNSNSNNNFFSGFLIGLLVGGAVVFLLGTKKGKKLLKAISEEGIDNISNILEEANKSSTSEKVLDKSVDMDEVEGEELDEIVEKPAFVETSHVAEALTDKSARQGEFAVKEKSFEKPRVRRFFRGISRRVN